MRRLGLTLGEAAEWLRVFDPRGGTLFVADADPVDPGSEVRVDLVFAEGGPRLVMRGSVQWSRAAGDEGGPPGVTITLGRDNREKVNFINGYVRGGLLNRREQRRLPLRLPVTYGGYDGPVDSYTRDLSDEGVFIVTEAPLGEKTMVHVILHPPLAREPLSLKGHVSHTVIVEDEDIPGMGVRFAFEDGQREELQGVLDVLEQQLLNGTLAEDYVT